jgi:1-phosphofructokinase family hexose kinase
VIVVAGFNTSIDKRVELDRFHPGAVHRATCVEAYPGGKGLHVALTVAALGEPVALVGLVDRTRELTSFLAVRGIAFHGVPVSTPLRTCLAIYEADGRVTELLEPGPEVPSDAAEQLVATFHRLASAARIAVISGSLPPGLADDTYAHAIEALHRDGIRCIVDASGEPLRLAVQARPFLVKPNRDEAERLTATPLRDPATAGSAALRIADAVEVAVISLGQDGAVAASRGALVHAGVELVDARHPVGSGDAMVAGLAVAFARGLEVPDALRLGVACGAANARSPQPGFVSRREIEELLPQVSVHPRGPP